MVHFISERRMCVYVCVCVMCFVGLEGGGGSNQSFNLQKSIHDGVRRKFL